eukprot:TRINITY_DN10219_c0_g1_i2.p1 TRINITY_DN10219_c0_g1~~TRINITY_DN10219_c0_g1_i2.p1  ORF type:complete len:105 (+),score=29.47 TRINITY_DN10219_c0_g1_i2:62-376(+)
MHSALRTQILSPTSLSPLRVGLLSCYNLYHSRQISRSSTSKPADPIVALYTQKLQEFKLNKQKSKDELFGSTPEGKKLYNKEVDRLQKMYGGGKLEEFPKFSFE